MPNDESMDRETTYVYAPDDEQVEGETLFFVAREAKLLGDTVVAGEECCLLEELKCVLIVPAAASGVITKVLVDDEDELEPGQPIYEISSLDSEEGIIEAATKILAERFSEREPRLRDLLRRVAASRLSGSMKVLATCSPEEILLHLTRDE